MMNNIHHFFCLMILAAFQVVGAGRDVVAFYRDGDHVVVKRCENGEIPDGRALCPHEPGTSVRRIGVSGFRRSLKKFLAVSIPWHLPPMRDQNQEYIKNWFKGRVQRVEAVRALMAKNADPGRFARIEQAFDHLENGYVSRDALSYINRQLYDGIGALVEDTVVDEKPYYYGSWERTGLLFNLLKAYHTMTPVTFRRIEAGSFTMGSPPGEPGRHDDEDQEEVVISRAFEIMTTEVTQMHWFLIEGGNPSVFKRPRDCPGEHIPDIDGIALCPNNPVENIYSFDAQAYILKSNELLALDSGCKRWLRRPEEAGAGCLRLPTEAEWEMAARAGTTTAYSFGNSSSPESMGGNVWYWRNSRAGTNPVAMKDSNPYGLYDMHGNVSEWTLDRYGEELPGGKDPFQDQIYHDFSRGRMVSHSSVYVVRGGNWASHESTLRSADRSVEAYKGENVGFRPVRAL